MNVVGVIEQYGSFIVTANIDGDFDKRGLPDPLVLAFYFTPHDDQIVQLIILRNRYDIWQRGSCVGLTVTSRP